MKVEGVFLKLLLLSVNFFFFTCTYYYPEIEAMTSWVCVEGTREPLSAIDMRWQQLQLGLLRNQN